MNNQSHNLQVLKMTFLKPKERGKKEVSIFQLEKKKKKKIKKKKKKKKKIQKMKIKNKKILKISEISHFCSFHIYFKR